MPLLKVDESDEDLDSEVQVTDEQVAELLQLVTLYDEYGVDDIISLLRYGQDTDLNEVSGS